MKKKIAILGSTGSIGKSTIDIIRKNKKDFEVILLTTNNNHRELIKQVLEFKPKNIIINNEKKYLFLKKKFNKKSIKIFNNFKSFNSDFKNKIDFTMSSISGLDGLKPTLEIIKFSKTIAIANKESIICAWNLIQKKLKKYKTKFIPVDSEHFSIWSLLDKNNRNNVEKVIITASGGPFLKLPLSKFNKIKPRNAIKHPTWKMGNKISVDSATLMNKVFEVIEAKKIFNLPYNKILILTHPHSYIHTIIKFKNGLIKILAHDPDMKIPIFNLLNSEGSKLIKTSQINLEILNNLNLKKVDTKKFMLVKILEKLPKNTTLFETVLITVNDYFVGKFLKKEVNFKKMIFLIDKYVKSKKFQKYKRIKPKNIEDIYRLRNYVSSKMDSLVI